GADVLHDARRRLDRAVRRYQLDVSGRYVTRSDRAHPIFAGGDGPPLAVSNEPRDVPFPRRPPAGRRSFGLRDAWRPGYFAVRRLRVPEARRCGSARRRDVRLGAGALVSPSPAKLRFSASMRLTTLLGRAGALARTGPSPCALRATSSRSAAWYRSPVSSFGSKG